MSLHPDMPGPCRDCGCAPGETHRPGCDIARCMNCGGQEISCDCDPDDPIVSGLARDVWLEEWPGSAECREFGFYAILIPGEGWMPCHERTPGATPHTSRLASTCRWDRSKRRWVRR